MKRPVIILLAGLLAPWESSAQTDVAIVDVPAAIVERPALLAAEIGGSLGADVITRADLFFRRSGDPEFFSIRMVRDTDDLFRATIPAFVVSERGVDYFVSARDVLGDTLRSPPDGHHSLQVRIPAGFIRPAPNGDEADGFRILSLPGHLDHASVDSVFFDDFGPYDPTLWRLYGETALGPVLEYGSSPIRVEPGIGFWLLNRSSDASFDTGPLTTVATSHAFELLLQPQWNLVGNPFTFDIPRERVNSAQSIRKPEEGQLRVWRYDGTWTRHPDAWTPFEGYAIFNPFGTADTLIVEPDALGTLTGPASKRSTNPAMEIRIAATKGRARDPENVALLSLDASSGWDRLDEPEPPTVGDFVSVAFEGERWELSTDARPEPGWRFTVRAATPGIVDLDFTLSAGESVQLFDPVTGVVRSLDAQPSYSLVLADAPRTLELHLGRISESTPAQASLSPPFPNPTAGPVTIMYDLPEHSKVVIEIFDLLGRLVGRVPADGPRKGRNVAVWDGSGLSPGVYLVRLRADAGKQFRSFTMVR